MKFAFTLAIGFILLLPGVSQGIEFEDFRISEQVPFWLLSKHEFIKVPGNFIVSDFLNPLYFEADFNGDNELDIALAIREKESGRKGILVLHGGSLEAHVMGAGKEFDIVKHLDWMEVWWVYREDTAEETIFSEDFDIVGSNTVQLDRVAIRVGKFESTSNLIYWDGSKYTWIHTGD